MLIKLLAWLVKAQQKSEIRWAFINTSAQKFFIGADN